MNTKTSITNAYDNAARAYAAALWNELEGKPFDQLFLRWFAERLPPGETVLEIGSGPGEVAAFLQHLGVNCLATDISSEMMAAGKNYFPALTFEIQDFFNLTYADASFAGVVGFYAIVNLRLTEVKDVLAEVLRVLQPGGIFLFSFHAAENTKELEVENFFDIEDNPLTFYYFNADEIKAMLEQTGFEVMELLLRYPYPKAEYPSKRAYGMARKPISAAPYLQTG